MVKQSGCGLWLLDALRFRRPCRRCVVTPVARGSWSVVDSAALCPSVLPILSKHHGLVSADWSSSSTVAVFTCNLALVRTMKEDGPPLLLSMLALLSSQHNSSLVVIPDVIPCSCILYSY